MNLYGTECKIGGIPCGMVLRGSANGKYLAVFEREYATLDQVEAIDWDKPGVEGDCILPAGYGFSVEDIQYNAGSRSFTVALQAAEQYLGDVAGYQTQVEELTAAAAQQAANIENKDQQITELTSALQSRNETIQAMEAAGTAESVKADLNAAYTEGVESNG